MYNLFPSKQNIFICICSGVSVNPVSGPGPQHCCRGSVPQAWQPEEATGVEGAAQPWSEPQPRRQRVYGPRVCRCPKELPGQPPRATPDRRLLQRTLSGDKNMMHRILKIFWRQIVHPLTYGSLVKKIHYRLF